jgi:hypothetical protein
VQFDKAVTVLSKLSLCPVSPSNLAQFFPSLIFNFYYLVNKRKANFSSASMLLFKGFSKTHSKPGSPEPLARLIISFFVRYGKIHCELHSNFLPDDCVGRRFTEEKL